MRWAFRHQKDLQETGYQSTWLARQVNKLHEPFIEKEILYRLNELSKDHPYFVKIHNTESDDDNIYLVLEFCSGGTLEHFAMSNSAFM